MPWSNYALSNKLDDEKRQTIFRLVEKMLTNKKFKVFFKKMQKYCNQKTKEMHESPSFYNVKFVNFLFSDNYTSLQIGSYLPQQPIFVREKENKRYSLLIPSLLSDIK